MNVCKICGRKYQYNRKGGMTKEKCNTCLVNHRRFKLKTKCVEYLSGKCKRCGYNTCLQALCFHHLDPTQKEFNISGSHCRKWQDIQDELDKCVLLCQNCHHEYHAGLWQ